MELSKTLASHAIWQEKGFFAALRRMHNIQLGLARRKLSVFTVKRVICEKTKESCAQCLIPHERTLFIIV